MKKTFAITFLAFATSFAQQALAIDIFNSGPTDGSLSATYNNGPTNYQSHARLISLDKAYTITDVSSFFKVQRQGLLQVSIYDNTRSVPSELLFTASSFAGTTNSPQWVGVHGLNWTLKPGDYWVAFSGDEGGFYGNSPIYSNVDKPIAIAHINNLYTDWFRHGEGSNEDVALWVQGNVATVPEPSIGVLVAIGGFALLFAQRRIRQS